MEKKGQEGHYHGFSRGATLSGISKAEISKKSSKKNYEKKRQEKLEKK